MLFRSLFDAAEKNIDEIDQMLAASHRQLNAEFGFALSTQPKPQLDAYRRELQRVESAYGQYFGVTRLWRMSERGFLSQVLQVLLSRLRVVFENAAAEVELWGKTSMAQMDTQLRERRRGLLSRRDAFARIQVAGDELERRIQEVEEQGFRLESVGESIVSAVDGLRILAATVPRAGHRPAAAEPGPRLALVHSTAPQVSRGAA